MSATAPQPAAAKSPDNKRRMPSTDGMPWWVEKLVVPALFLLAAFVALLAVLYLLQAPQDLILLTLSMGLASAAVALITLLWKASAHCTVAGHAAAAGVLLLGPWGLVFFSILPLVIWSRIVTGAHTLLQTLAGTAIGTGFAVLALV